MNIYREFKLELGYSDVANQYVELSQRVMKAKYRNKMDDQETFKAFAQQYGLNIQDLHGGVEIRIAQSYIIKIQSSFELFLEKFIKLTGSPMQSAAKKDDKTSILNWIVENVYKNKKIQNDVQIVMAICEYYRLVRNCIIHKNDDKKQLDYKKELKFLQRDPNKELLNSFIVKLNALNEPQNITFDDQVLFSKAVCWIAERIYYDSIYDIDEYVNENRNLIKNMISPYHNNRKRMIGILKNHLVQMYPISSNIYDSDIENIINQLLE